MRIEDYFRRSIEELNQIGEPIRARFEKIDNVTFAGAVLNKGVKNKEAYITIRSGGDGPFGNGITYSYSRRTDAINGFVLIDADEYELYLKADGFGLQQASNEDHMSADQVADALWREFTSHAGIDHD